MPGCREAFLLLLAAVLAGCAGGSGEHQNGGDDASNEDQPHADGNQDAGQQDLGGDTTSPDGPEDGEDTVNSDGGDPDLALTDGADESDQTDGSFDDECPEGQIVDDDRIGCIPLATWQTRALPETGDPARAPGEREVGSGARNETWTIEWYDHEGLDHNAYRSIVRPPYLQRVTPDEATVLWRVSSDLPLYDITASLRYAPAGSSLDDGIELTVGQGIDIGYVDDTYVYETGVSFEHPIVEEGESDYWLNYLVDRPIIELRATLGGLQPDTVYHYMVESDTQHPVYLGSETGRYVLAQDVVFRSAPRDAGRGPLRFLAMGDLGPGDEQPSYFYDVFDLFHHAARRYSASLWLVLGDLDNDTDGHPNAMDPFFFNVYNAYHDFDFSDPPNLTSSVLELAELTSVPAFGRPPYHGLLGGLPAYPTFGNHDICAASDSSLAYWSMAYRGNFALPDEGMTGFEPGFLAAARAFNDGSDGFYYTFRYGNVIFISLGVPRDTCELGNGSTWWTTWGSRQMERLETYLDALQDELARETVWVIVYLHDHNWLDRDPLRSLALDHGVDLVIAGHDHGFDDFTVWDGERSYRALIVGTGGFGDTDEGDQCRRPGFVLFEVDGAVLEYWKLDTHETDAGGNSLSRDSLSPTIREYRKIRREGLGRHRIFTDEGSDPYVF